MNRFRLLHGFWAVPMVLAAWACGGGDLVLPSGAQPQVTVVQGDEQIAPPASTLAEPLIVRLVDATGRGIPDRAVVWVVNAGGGSIDPATGTTDAEGFASAEWTLGPAEGPNRVDAQVPGIGTVIFTAIANQDGGGQLLRLEPVEGAGQAAPAGSPVPIPPAVRVVDDGGDPVAGIAVSFVVTGGGGAVSGAEQTTDAEGIARVGSWTLGSSPGPNTLEARAAGLTEAPAVFTATGTGTSTGTRVERLVFRVPPGNVDKDERFTVEVALVDAEGTVVPLDGIFIYVGLFREGRDRPTNDDLNGERFENTDAGIAVFDLSIEEEGRYRLRALTDDLPELGPHGPEPFLYSEVFEVD